MVSQHVVRFGIGGIGAIWAEPHFGFWETILIALVFLGVPLLSLVGIIGALVSWRRGHQGAAVALAALAIGCAWLTISVMPGVGSMFRLLKIPLLLLVGIVGTQVLRRRGHGRAAVAFAALAIGCAWLTVSSLGGSETASARRTAPDQFAADEAPMTLSGGQEESRRPFELRNGRYTVRWTATVRPSEPSCRLRINLRSVRERLMFGEGQGSYAVIVDRTLSPQSVTTASGER